MGPERRAVEEFAFEGREEAVAVAAIEAVADKAQRWPVTRTLAPVAEGIGSVLSCRGRMTDDVAGLLVLERLLTA